MIIDTCENELESFGSVSSENVRKLIAHARALEERLTHGVITVTKLDIEQLDVMKELNG